MQVLKTKWFTRFARKAGLSNQALLDAIKAAEQGLIDADLGGGVIKQRVARGGEGKSGGFRTIILFRSGSRAFFVYGFAKADRDNIQSDEMEAFRLLAAEMLAYDNEAMRKAIEAGVLAEVTGDDKAVS